MSLAFEQPHANLMMVPPRSMETDRLISTPLLLYAYTQIGLIETIVCLSAYFLAFLHYNINPKELFQNNYRYFDRHHTKDQNYISESGHIFTKAEQMEVLASVQASWFLLLVASQAVHVFLCRSSIDSIFKYNFFSNKLSLIGVVTAAALSGLIVYYPYLQQELETGPVPVPVVFSAFSISVVLLVAWSESRKIILRNFPSSTVSKYLHW